MESRITRRKLVTASSGALVLLAGCSGSVSTPETETDGSDGQSPTATETTAPDSGDTDDSGSQSTDDSGNQSKTTTVPVGETVSDDSLAMVVRSVETTESLGEFQEADSGNTFVVVRMAVKNKSEEFINFNSFFQTRVKDSSNTVYNATFGMVDHPIQSGVLASGEVARGDVVFEVPKDASGLSMQFDFGMFDLFDFDRVTVELEQQAGSIADLNQSLNVNVFSPGEKASHENVTVTVHGVRTTSELGSFAQADEGHEYVIPDIEVTNDTDEELTVSTLLQMRVKTGTGLAYTADIMGSSALDKGYSEGSPISPGASRRGELAYQVKKDAGSLYWSFDFLDFSEDTKAFWKLK